MARLVSLATTALVSGVIGFGLGVYAEPNEQTEQFRSLVRRGIDAIDAAIGADESENASKQKPSQEQTELRKEPPQAETAAPAAAPVEPADNSAIEHQLAPPVTPQGGNAAGLPDSSPSYGTPAPGAPAPVDIAPPPVADSGKKPKPKSPPKTD